MSELDKLMIARRTILAEITKKTDILPQLHERVGQRIKELFSKCRSLEAEGKGVLGYEVIARNKSRLDDIASKVLQTGGDLDRFGVKIEALVPDPATCLSFSQEKTLNEDLARSITALESSQSILEVQLLELDRVSDEIDLLFGSSGFA